ncbi:hypothetical protein EVAR_86866_1 [Eumeta japonica]|uniref:Uncharacterized protein n=1 Tax=Eumeta variegata TaxID=151549 RepID=A0A4C1VVM2_EUMVA|nr:hypothetical protein EVAR_86866_1 [Eumeta japonica]
MDQCKTIEERAPRKTARMLPRGEMMRTRRRRQIDNRRTDRVQILADRHLDRALSNTRWLEMLRLRVLGPVATVRETSIVDEYGTELAKLPFSYEPGAGRRRNFEPDDEPPALTTDLLLPAVAGSRVYVKITGRDMSGESFVRLSGPLPRQKNERSGRAAVSFPQQYNDERTIRALSNINNSSDVVPSNRATSQVINQSGALLTTVQIGLGTRIYGAPGTNLQVLLDLFLADRAAKDYASHQKEWSHSHLCTFTTPEQSPLRYWLFRQVLGSGEMVNVVVSVRITSTAQPGARDFVTFTAFGNYRDRPRESHYRILRAACRSKKNEHNSRQLDCLIGHYANLCSGTGREQVSISTYVYVVNANTAVTDIWPPTLRHDFQGSCIGRQGDDCAQYAWSTTIFARDAVGGLLRLSSTPIGLTYQSNFVSGTREEVTATYRATCCAPRVTINAVDAYGNGNSYVIDISNYFTSAEIAAIALGVLLFIALIIVIAFLIYWCVRRRKESRELPYSTSRRDIS